MPGLVVITEAEERADEILLDKMIESITHESWYKIDKFLGCEFAIARVHLGVLNPELQPIYNEDKSFCIFMDGEIFDYDKEKEELRRKGHKFYANNDPEFCLHLYEEYGEKFVEKLNGSFTIAIADINTQKLLIVNDRYGLRPLYYAKRDGKLLFASEVKAILKDDTFKKEINDEAIAEFFTFGQLQGSKTFFEGIEVLPPASILKWESGKMVMEQYWEFKFEEEHSSYDEKYYTKTLVVLFKKSIERKLKNGKKIGIFLSGGLDSSCVAAGIPNEKRKKITAVTFSFRGMDKSLKIAKKVAEELEIPHKILWIEPTYLVDYAKKAVYLTDGMLPLIHFHEISILSQIRKHGDIMIHGWEPETTFKGEFLSKEIISCKDDEELCKNLYNKCKSVNERDLANLLSSEFFNRIKNLSYNSLKSELKDLKGRLAANKSDSFLFKNREMRSMVLGLVYKRSIFENREPFRDYDLLDFSLQIPPNLRYNHRIYFKFMKKLNPKIKKNTGANNLYFYKLFRLKNLALLKVVNILKIKSRGLIKIPLRTDYPDYGGWIREDEKLKKWVESILLDERTLSRKYFNRNFIFKMVRDHMSYKKDYTQLIFLLLTFELWYRIFIEGEEVA